MILNSNRTFERANISIFLFLSCAQWAEIPCTPCNIKFLDYCMKLYEYKFNYAYVFEHIWLSVMSVLVIQIDCIQQCIWNKVQFQLFFAYEYSLTYKFINFAWNTSLQCLFLATFFVLIINKPQWHHFKIKNSYIFFSTGIFQNGIFCDKIYSYYLYFDNFHL